MSVYVLTVENLSGCNVLGIYLTEKMAKVAAIEYVEKQENIVFKKKVMKGEEKKKLMYLENSKEEGKSSVFMTEVYFEMPKSVGVKSKKSKDPNAPKKGMSAFMIFSNEYRNKVKSENPECSFGEVGKKVGEAWKALSDEQKQVYVKKAEEDKKRYESELQTYTEVQTTVA